MPNDNEPVGMIWRGEMTTTGQKDYWYLTPNNGMSFLKQPSRIGLCPAAFMSAFDAISFAVTAPAPFVPDKNALKPYPGAKSAILAPDEPIVVMRRLIQTCPNCGKVLSEPSTSFDQTGKPHVVLHCDDCGIDLSPLDC